MADMGEWMNGVWNWELNWRRTFLGKRYWEFAELDKCC